MNDNLCDPEHIQQEPDPELQDHYATWKFLAVSALGIAFLCAVLLGFIELVRWAMHVMEPLLAGVGVR